MSLSKVVQAIMDGNPDISIDDILVALPARIPAEELASMKDAAFAAAVQHTIDDERRYLMRNLRRSMRDKGTVIAPKSVRVEAMRKLDMDRWNALLNHTLYVDGKRKPLRNCSADDLDKVTLAYTKQIDSLAANRQLIEMIATQMRASGVSRAGDLDGASLIEALAS